MNSHVSDDPAVGRRPCAASTACRTSPAAWNCPCVGWLASGQQVICEGEMPVEGPTTILVHRGWWASQVSGAKRDVGAEDTDEPQLDEAPRPTGLMETPVAPSLAGQDITEDVIPPEDKPVARRVAEATIQLRRWIVAGLGVLMGLILLIAPLLVLIRPALVDFARTFLQIALAGLFGLGGTVVGFLFAGDKDR